ncbi:MAG: spore germination protein [Paenibacillus sp.]|jgi:spore germination protein KB|uniref:GerAB/ArcD/ProY family transporter n=1 Tax=Paenibacillus sp. GCM10012303 TaxID=3317340 RepID=UPI0029F024E3|nr:spore germination protein [Paenibacillus sp.]
MNQRKITARQLKHLVTLFTVGSSALFIPLSISSQAKQDAWISIMLGMAFSLGLIKLYTVISRLAPGCTIGEMNRKWLGKWLGSAVNVLYIFTALATGAASLISYLGNFIITQIIEDTPATVIHILFTLVVLMGMQLGLGTLARASEVMYPAFFILFVALIVMVLPNMKLEHLQPAFASGVKPVLSGTLDYVSFSSMPLVFFMMIFPGLVDATRQEAVKALYIGSLKGGAYLLIITVVCISVLGLENTLQQVYPSYALAKKINIANFLTRIEVIMATLWIISLFYKLIIYFYAGLKGIGQLLKLQDDTVLIAPVCVLLVVISLTMYPNAAYSKMWDSKIWPPYIQTFGLLLPLLLWVVGSVRSARQGKTRQGSPTSGAGQ